jgi:thiamine-monophosphate kinase
VAGRPAIEALAAQIGHGITRIGRIEQGTGVTVVEADGQPVALPRHGWRHF